MSDQGKDLSPDQWQRVKEVFSAALERAPAARAAFLDEACGAGDALVRREVEALLAAHQASDTFLNTPAAVGAPVTPTHGGLVEGQPLGPYRVLRTLGHGGMATVYLARDERHHRSVALKVLHSDLAHALGPERFLREIEVAANLSHPHILPLHDSGEAAGLLYYVMPYVEGESLRDRLRRETQLPVEEALQLAREVADALAYAHGQGVIHRDIKPENILLGAGHALVADFGIARALSQADSARLTESGMAIGTAAYMSPEQASAATHIDGRSDVYSLGCVLYEMLAGEPPHTGPNAQAIIARAMTERPRSIHTIRPRVSPSLEAVTARAMAITVADRYASAAEFVRALESVRHSPTPEETREGRQSSRRFPVLGSPTQRTLLGMLVLGLLVGAGVLFGSRRSHGGGKPAGEKLVAVLPFENLGDSADAYFADGVANDLRTKLTQIPGLQVIARGSSNEYRKTTKTQQQIARELGVNYLLTATVQWERGAGGASRVRVTPELVDVHPGRAPLTRWGQQFDAAMSDVFQVQAEIAGQVAQALNVALGDSVKQELAVKPTQSLPAYDAFLRGEAASQEGVSANDTPSLRRAVAAYEQAVALDSTFALAWAQLARAQAILDFNGTRTPARAEAVRRAAERAQALAPTRPDGHRALGLYYDVLVDNAHAFMEDSTALALAPRNAELLGAVGQDELSLGRTEAAREHLEQAARLEPRSAGNALGLGIVLFSTRQYPQAEQAFDRALRLVPANLNVREYRAMVALAQGDLAGARAVLRGTPKKIDPIGLIAFVARYWDLIWVLDEAQQQLLLRLRPSAFDDDRGTWGIVLAQTYAFQGNVAKAQVYADSARIANEEQLKAAPDDAQLHVFLGLAFGYLGHKAAAIREGQRGVALLPISRDANIGPYIQHQLARIYLLVGEPEKALDQLEPLLKMPYYLSPGWLKIDPNFAPLRGNPRFQRLVNAS
jgi:eukaryotic-like serine/threonine-protein kinase